MNAKFQLRLLVQRCVDSPNFITDPYLVIFFKYNAYENCESKDLLIKENMVFIKSGHEEIWMETKNEANGNGLL